MTDDHHEHDLSPELTEALEGIAEALGRLVDPVTGMPLDETEAEIEVGYDDGTVFAGVTLGYPCGGLAGQWEEMAQEACRPLMEKAPLVGSELQFDLFFEAAGTEAPDHSETLAGVKQIIAVASGKGGVGKSTTAVNLALALVAEGARVGILDADIYGPSMPLMLGVKEGTRPEVEEQKFFVPIEAHGLKTMSLGYLMTEDTPAVWRGPMAGGALQQILGQTRWGDLDYLIVDMPPGTGDIQLTLSQKATLAGAIIVTTPQDLALLDAIKGVEMFRKVEVPVLGIVENMAIHTCSSCGHKEHIFGAGGGEKMAESYGVCMLGSLPLAMSIREQADSGNPTVAADPDSDESLIYRAMARRATAEAWLNADDGPEIEIV
ncbi:iron-sulfur cluster carrier protein ApbC [Biformimicrobium ophioploci]|uniref:Iron-sulfur cluster carrier protein n=1 Tax=Biformimicrobium ophioploci TaxID=3036711 RepID=A0ABQ6LYQ9_9GAMM|nr:iron-sulfur cluster carrier protein ApbC [Microbulbifer sp. NKW57]GMG87196.1 iron-sulfur cluster carrier protein ApbC [Microbulbifer sp. NKW57]